jgi:hypothetical protein
MLTASGRVEEVSKSGVLACLPRGPDLYRLVLMLRPLYRRLPHGNLFASRSRADLPPRWRATRLRQIQPKSCREINKLASTVAGSEISQRQTAYG